MSTIEQSLLIGDLAIDDEAQIDEFPSFFALARLNFAENILSRQSHGLAVIEIVENGSSESREYSWQELRELVQHYANALSSAGLAKGEVVARTTGLSVSHVSG